MCVYICFMKPHFTMGQNKGQYSEKRFMQSNILSLVDI